MEGRVSNADARSRVSQAYEPSVAGVSFSDITDGYSNTSIKKS